MKIIVKEDLMDGKMFMIGLMIGALGGAFLVANSQKAREAVKTSQEQIKEKAEELTKNCQCGKKSDE